MAATASLSGQTATPSPPLTTMTSTGVPFVASDAHRHSDPGAVSYESVKVVTASNDAGAPAQRASPHSLPSSGSISASRDAAQPSATADGEGAGAAGGSDASAPSPTGEAAPRAGESAAHGPVHGPAHGHGHGHGHGWAAVKAVVALEELSRMAKVRRFLRNLLGTASDGKWLSLRHPHSRVRRYINGLLFLCIMYNAISVSYRVAFHALDGPVAWGVLTALDACVDCIMFFDVIWHFFIGYYNMDGAFESNLTKAARHYLRGDFALDLFAVFPVDWLFWTRRANTLRSIVRLNRLFAIRRIPGFFRWWEWHSSMASTMRLVKMLLTVFVMSHFCACLFYLVHKATIADQSTVAASAWGDGIAVEGHTTRTSGLFIYAQCQFWAMSFLTSMGPDKNPPSTTSQLAVSYVFLFAGVLLLSSVIGQIADIVANMNKSEQLARERMDMVNMWLRYRRLPDDVAIRVRQYYEYLFSKQRGIDDQNILADFPVHLRRDVSGHMYEDLLKRVEFFAGAPPAFLSHLILKLRPEIYGPNDYIVKVGEIGTSMYFIKSGVVRVELENKKVINKLTDGAFFGEIAILLNKRRTANCIADTFTDVFVLSRKDVHAAMKLYPAAAEIIQKTATERLQRDIDQAKKRELEEAAAAAAASGAGSPPSSASCDQDKRAARNDGQVALPQPSVAAFAGGPGKRPMLAVPMRLEHMMLSPSTENLLGLPPLPRQLSSVLPSMGLSRMPSSSALSDEVPSVIGTPRGVMSRQGSRAQRDAGLGRQPSLTAEAMEHVANSLRRQSIATASVPQSSGDESAAVRSRRRSLGGSLGLHPLFDYRDILHERAPGRTDGAAVLASALAELRAVQIDFLSAPLAHALTLELEPLCERIAGEIFSRAQRA